MHERRDDEVFAYFAALGVLVRKELIHARAEGQAQRRTAWQWYGFVHLDEPSVQAFLERHDLYEERRHECLLGLAVHRVEQEVADEDNDWDSDGLLHF